jgi:hypothetical protein
MGVLTSRYGRNEGEVTATTWNGLCSTILPDGDWRWVLSACSRCNGRHAHSLIDGALDRSDTGEYLSTQIEEFLFGHPSVADVQVFGVPDSHYGEELCAWIRLRPGVSVTEDDIRGFCRGRGVAGSGMAAYRCGRRRFVSGWASTAIRPICVIQTAFAGASGGG